MPRGNRLLGVVSSEAKRMGRLIDDLLAFLKARVACTWPKRTSTLPHWRVPCLRNLTQTGPAPRFDLKPLPPTEGDVGMLRQVFVNLLSNAIKFTRHQPAPLIEVGSRNDESVTTYYVKIMAWDLMRNTPTNCLAFSSGCIARMSLKARAWGWRWSSASSSAMAARSGPKENLIRGQFFISHYQQPPI